MHAAQDLEAPDGEARLVGRMVELAILDEYTPECLAMDVARRMSHRDVMDRLAVLFIEPL